MYQRCRDHGKMEQVVRVPQQIEFPWSPPLWHPGRIQTCTNLPQHRSHQYTGRLAKSGSEAGLATP